MIPTRIFAGFDGGGSKTLCVLCDENGRLLGTGSGGDGKYAPALARAAVATGVDGVFMETHVNPKKALSDAANALAFKDVKPLWKTLLALHKVVNGGCA